MQVGTTAQEEDPRAQDQDRPDVQQQRREFCAKLAGLDPRRLVFVDESGANTAMTRTYGRAPVGQRVYTNTPGSWESITMTCGLRLSGVTAPLAFRGATNTDIFETYVQEVLVPELKPGDVVIWDNLKPHKSEEAIEAIEATGARVEPLPPYSPDLSPIEEMVSKVKGAMRSAAARTTNAVYWAFASALDQVTLEDITGWFQSRAAYAMQLWSALVHYPISPIQASTCPLDGCRGHGLQKGARFRAAWKPSHDEEGYASGTPVLQRRSQITTKSRVASPPVK